jgi:hypothetical protein
MTITLDIGTNLLAAIGLGAFALLVRWWFGFKIGGRRIP